MTQLYFILIKLLNIILLTFVLFSFSVPAKDITSVAKCQAPLKDYDITLLKDIKFHNDNNIPKSGVVISGFKVQCSSGNIELLSGEKVTFNKNGTVSELTVGNITFLSQKETKLKLPAKSTLKISPEGLVTEAYGISTSSVIINEKTIPIKEKAHFYESGNFNWGLITNSSQMEFQYFGNAYTAKEGERFYITPSGNIFIEGMKPNLVGDWTLNQKSGNLKFSLDSNNNGMYQIFLLSGDPSVLDVSINNELLRAISSLVEPFDLNHSPEAKMKFHGFKEVPNPNGEGTVFEPIYTQATLKLVDERIDISFKNGERFSFLRDSWAQRLGNLVKTVLQASVSFFVLLTTLLLVLIGWRSLNRVVDNSKIDKRYKRNQGKSKAFGYLMVPVFILIIGISFHSFILDYFRIGSFLDYIGFFFY